MKFTLIAAATLAATSVQAGDLNVWTSDESGFLTHSIWYDDGQEVTVVDTQFTLGHAEAMVAEIQEKTDSPITRIIVTHPSPDKFNALSVFHEVGAQSIASDATIAAIPGVDAYKKYFWVEVAGAFTNETYPVVEPVQTGFSGTYVITLKSGETITLSELATPGIASTQTVVRFDATGDLAVGDLVHYQNHAWLEGGIVDGAVVPTLDGWKAGLRELEGLSDGMVYGGRGAFGKVADVVPAQIAYLVAADRIVGAYVNGLADKAELTAPETSGAHYAAIQAQLVAAFPDYSFPDLVSYSVYGLVNQKLMD